MEKLKLGEVKNYNNNENKSQVQSLNDEVCGLLVPKF